MFQINLSLFYIEELIFLLTLGFFTSNLPDMLLSKILFVCIYNG